MEYERLGHYAACLVRQTHPVIGRESQLVRKTILLGPLEKDIS